MSFKVIPSQRFQRAARPLLKKYPSLKNELRALGRSLAESPEQGTSLGKGCYKIRLAIQSKGRGKSGGARVITYLLTEDQRVVLLTIYDKAQKADLEPGELDDLLESLNDSREFDLFSME